MKKLLILFGIAFLLTSCSNDEPQAIKLDKHANEQFSMIAKYNGKIYDVTGIEIDDTVMYLNDEFNRIYTDEISKLSQKAIITYFDNNGNQIVGYYKSAEELERDNDINHISINHTEYIQTRGSNDSIKVTPPSGVTVGRAVLYDDTGFQDRRVIIDVSNSFFYCLHLQDLGGFNDKTSAIRLFNFHPTCNGYPVNINPPVSSNGNKYICLIGYEDNLYYNSEGKIVHGDCDILYCVSTHSGNENIKIPNSANHQDYKLKNIGWNDKITGVVVGIISSESLNITIHPHN